MRLHLCAHPIPPPRGAPLADRKRVAADGSYKIRKFAETSDNPLYRLPEQPQGGHRLDGFNPWTAQAAHYQHH